MNTSVCVVFSDIVAWTTQDLSAQITSAQELFTRLVTKLHQYGLETVWRTSTGDGFAVAFSRECAIRVLQMCADMHDEYAAKASPAVRIAAAEGTLETFHNTLVNASDCTGPGIVKARRILDGITAGNVLLVDRHLAEDCIGLLPQYLASFFVEHPEISDKHGTRHPVVEVLSRVKKRDPVLTLPPDTTTWANQTKDPAVTDLEAARGDKVFGIDSLILMWLADNWGMEATALKVSPALPADGRHTSLASLATLSGQAAEYSAHHYAWARDTFGEPNNPKLWLKAYRTPMTDRPLLDLEVGRTDYWSARAIEPAFEGGGLRQRYESMELDIHRDLPGMVATHSVIVTVDGCLILAQRKGGEVDFAGGTYSTSFEEQWNPLCDRTPQDAVLRGLREEFNLDRDHGVFVTVDNLRLIALAREWGRFWHTVMLYFVRLPATATKVLECWNAVPPPRDKNEHTAVGAVPLLGPEARSFLEGLLKRPSRISPKMLERACGVSCIAGSPSDGEVHPTSGRVRILAALSAARSLS